MVDLGVIREMQTMDCLRAAAFFIGISALLAAPRNPSQRKSRDGVGIWLLGESIIFAVSGMAFGLMPEFSLSLSIIGKLDVFHLFYMRMLGCLLMGIAVLSYMLRDSPNRNMWLVARVVSGVSVTIILFMGYMSAGKNDAIKFKGQHLTTSMFAVSLMVMGCVCVLSKQTYLGNRTPGLRVVSKMDRHLLVDLMFATVDIILPLGFPAAGFGFVVDKNFKPDNLHFHLSHVVAAYALAPLLMAITSFQTGDRHDKRAYGFSRLVTFSLVCPLMLWYFWWYPMLTVEGQIFCWVYTISVMINLAVA